MNSDIVARLQQTFSGFPDEGHANRPDLTLHEQIEDLFRRELSEDEDMLIRAFRRMSGKKQEALKNLLS
jgi:hypothetical protein